MAAIDCLMKQLNPGDEVVSTSDLYGGTYRLYTKIFSRYGIKFHFIGMENAADIENYMTENTKLIWVETPTNPMMNIIDIAAMAAKWPNFCAIIPKWIWCCGPVLNRTPTTMWPKHKWTILAA